MMDHQPSWDLSLSLLVVGASFPDISGSDSSSCSAHMGKIWLQVRNTWLALSFINIMLPCIDFFGALTYSSSKNVVGRTEMVHLAACVLWRLSYAVGKKGNIELSDLRLYSLWQQCYSLEINAEHGDVKHWNKYTYIPNTVHHAWMCKSFGLK